MTTTTTYSTSAYPFDAVCYITDVINGTAFRASGVIIGPHTILTAAHVVWDATSGQSATNIQVTPGRGSLQTTFVGAAIHYNAVNDFNDDLSQSQSQSDFAVIDVTQDLSAYGSFGVDPNYGNGVAPGVSYSAAITGYPGAAGHSQQNATGSVTSDTHYNLIDYSSTTFSVSPGSSGGPIWINAGTVANPIAEVVGVVSTGDWGARLTASDWSEIQGWIAQDAHLWSQPFTQTAVTFVDTATGDWGYMTPTGTTEVWQPIGASSTAYTAIGSGDFNGDGQRDLAFRNTTTGDLGFMTPNGAGNEIWHAMGATSTAYAAAAVGDFNGDGSDDVAFVNTTTGDLGFMSATASGETWHGIGPSSTAYAVIGAADFNNDGTDSLVFRNTTTGDWGYMTANASGGETWTAVGPSSTAYAAIGIGDFNHDGVPDVAFRNPTTGDWGYMSLPTTGGEIWHAVGTTSTSYAAIKVADFNGDGLADIAFRNPTTGDWGYMTANLSGGETWHPVGSTSTDYYAVA